MKKIAFFLMTFKGYSVLLDLIERENLSYVDCVVIGTDKNTKNDYSQEMVELCKNNGIRYFFRKDDFKIESEYIVTVSWRWMIRNVTQKIIVFHESLLPKYRGFAPLVNQLINGEEEIGLSVLWGESEYDSGDIIGQYKLKIEYPIKIQDAIEQISELYRLGIRDLVKQLKKSGYIKTAWTQDLSEVSFSLWRDEKDYFINWNDSAENIKRFVDSVGFPYKGACTFMGKDLIRINDVDVIDDVKIEIRDIGKLIFIKDSMPVIVCKTGLLKIIDAIYEESGLSILPLKKFRIRMS